MVKYSLFLCVMSVRITVLNHLRVMAYTNVGLPAGDLSVHCRCA